MTTSISTKSSQRLVIVLAITTTVLTLGLVGLGSTVRVTNSGMGCPSWPLCYGQLGPIYRFHTILEESHRYLAATVSAFVVATLLASRTTPKLKLTRRWSEISAGLVLLQVLLGGLTVLAKNAPWTVSLHLIVGLIFLASTTTTATFAVIERRFESLSSISRIWGIGACIGVLLIFISGTTVVLSNSGPSCTTWPICTPGNPVTPAFIALTHRVIVLISTTFVGIFLYKGWRHSTRSWRKRTKWMILDLLAVIAVGALVAISRSAPFWADLHLIVATIFWMLLVVQVITHGVEPRTSRQSNSSVTQTTNQASR